MVCGRCRDDSFDLGLLYLSGRPVLRDHLLKVNHIFFGSLFLPSMFMSVRKKTSILVIKRV